jgi:hypothetical protein
MRSVPARVIFQLLTLWRGVKTGDALPTEMAVRIHNVNTGVRIFVARWRRKKKADKYDQGWHSGQLTTASEPRYTRTAQAESNATSSLSREKGIFIAATLLIQAILF